MLEQIFYYFITCWKKTFNYNGRARRLELYSFLIVTLFICIFLQTTETFIKNYITDYENFIYFTLSTSKTYKNITIKEPFYIFYTSTCIYALLSQFPLASLLSRRLQDVNKSKWWVLFLYSPIILIILFLISLNIGVDYTKLPEVNSEYILWTMLALSLYGLFLLLKIFLQKGKNEHNK